MQTLLPLLRCPQTGEHLRQQGGELVSESGRNAYCIDDKDIPLFAEKFCSRDALIQQRHYDEIADAYAANLDYPHTLEYMSYLDEVLQEVVDLEKLGVVAEVCCGTGEAFALFEHSISKGVGIDVSSSMLHKGKSSFDNSRLHFVQGDATQLPLAEDSFDTVIMLGGVHHVPDRIALFRQVFKILKPGGTYIWREPVSDFWLWKILRAIVYRVSPILDHATERPLTWNETVPLLEEIGFEVQHWRTCGFFGFCIFMNSDVLFFNRLFRFIPGIRHITRASARFDDWCTSLPGLRRAGLQVVGKAIKPAKGENV
ncbi:MAG: class I SAM-dependent methyltransferase [Gammaproteobacteria bacterium]